MAEPTTRGVIARCMWSLHGVGYRLQRTADFGTWRHFWLRSLDGQGHGIHLAAPRRERRP